jgi:hypothetical protein
LPRRMRERVMCCCNCRRIQARVSESLFAAPSDREADAIACRLPSTIAISRAAQVRRWPANLISKAFSDRSFPV